MESETKRFVITLIVAPVLCTAGLLLYKMATTTLESIPVSLGGVHPLSSDEMNLPDLSWIYPAAWFAPYALSAFIALIYLIQQLKKKLEKTRTPA